MTVQNMSVVCLTLEIRSPKEWTLDQLRQTVVDVARGDRRPDCDITHKILLYGSHRLHFMQA
eukprot:m.62783 g.62783  ORF g.62783 m.62783 type:complete len:62 (-) comp11535_c0_seq1:1769-1954(-)